MPDTSERAESIVHPYLEGKLRNANDDDSFPVNIFANYRRFSMEQPVSEEGVRRSTSRLRAPIEEHLQSLGIRRGIEESDYQVLVHAVHAVLTKEQIYALRDDSECTNPPYVESIMYNDERYRGGAFLRSSENS